jgi:two-component system phosphate regulon sensor histidine kinase PhoR
MTDPQSVPAALTLTQARVEFAAEFVTLVVTASALALLLFRPGLPRHRPDRDVRRRLRHLLDLSAVAALLVFGAATFAHGSLLVSGSRAAWLGVGRLAAGAVLLVAFPAPATGAARRSLLGGLLLRSGCGAWAAAGAVEALRGREYLIDGLLVAGSLLLAASLIQVGRRSIAVRVATSSAATLLLVVVVLALALSTVISSSLQNQELARLSSRAVTEKAALSDTSAVSATARTIEVYLAGSFSSLNPNPLVVFATPPSPATEAQFQAAARAIEARLDLLPRPSSSGIDAYASPDGRQVILAGTNQVIPASGFDAAPDLRATCQAGQQGLVALDSAIYVAASSPECTAGGQLVGVAVAASPLDQAYLNSRQLIDPGVGLALVSGERVLAASGVSDPVALQVAQSLHPASGQAVTEITGTRFASATQFFVATPRGGPQTVYLVLVDLSNTVLTDRDRLFRTLFLIAFGGTVLALGLAVFTGDRITARLRRLTSAAAGVARGDSTLRAAVPGEDEVAALGGAFDTMIDSVSAQAAALSAAAEDEARLRNRLEAVVAGMTEALVAVDADGLITDFNRAAAEMTGIPAGEALGQPATSVARLLNEDGVAVSGQLLAARGRPSVLAAQLETPSGLIPVSVSSGDLRGPAGDVVGSVLVMRDMRREEEVERMKTEFLSRIGHELRTPLTGILGYADILLRRPVNESMARAWYEDIRHSARRLLRIVEMLEFFASEGAGRVVLRPHLVDVRALVNGIASAWSERLPSNLTIGRRTPRSETLVSADQRWLTLAVDELIDNAVKFSPEGGRILLRVTPGAEWVDIDVADQGMGMTAEHRAVVFGDFVQGDNSDTRRFGGLGLGLAVVRRVVEGHGGRVTCRSAPGRGTTFTLRLPAGGDGSNGSGPPQSRAAEPTSHSSAATGVPAPPPVAASPEARAGPARRRGTQPAPTSPTQGGAAP